MLARDLRRLGTEVYTGARAVAMTEEGLRLDTGYELSADLVVLTAGGRPSTALARRAGLMVRRGVVVDSALRSVTDDRIHAIGDCAEHRSRATGFVPPAWEQAGRAGRRPLRRGRARYDGSRSVARLRATGLEVAVLGRPRARAGRGRRDDQPDRRLAPPLVVARGRIVAAALVGDLSRVGLITQLYDRGTVLGPDEPGQLLLGEPAAAPVDAARRRRGLRLRGRQRPGRSGPVASFDACRETTRATTGCGGCESVVRRLLGEDVAGPGGLSEHAARQFGSRLRAERGDGRGPRTACAVLGGRLSPGRVRPAERVGQQPGARTRSSTTSPGLEKAQLRRLRHPQPMQARARS